MVSDWPYSNPYRARLFNPTIFDNTAFSFSGNIQLTTDASYFNGLEPSAALMKDAILKGAKGLFSGSASFQQLMILILPILLIVHLAIVWCVTAKEGSGLQAYFITTVCMTDR